MDEELVAQLEKEARDADRLFGSPLHEDGDLLYRAAAEIRRLDRLLQSKKTEHDQLYGRNNSALYNQK